MIFLIQERGLSVRNMAKSFETRDVLFGKPSQVEMQYLKIFFFTTHPSYK